MDEFEQFVLREFPEQRTIADGIIPKLQDGQYRSPFVRFLFMAWEAARSPSKPQGEPVAQPLIWVDEDEVNSARHLGYGMLQSALKKQGRCQLPLYLSPPPHQAAQVPEGWKLVPVAQTNEMRDAAESAINRGALKGTSGCHRCHIDGWDASISASPPPPKAEQE